MPLEPWAVLEQQPSSLVLGQELTLEPVGQLVTDPAGYVKQLDMSELIQLMPAPPPPLLPLLLLLQAVSVLIPAVAETASTARPSPIK